jgi:1,4-alpha-glucan branching enzyme
MNPLPSQPVVYEINTAVWLHELEQSGNTSIDLATVPSEVWDELASMGIDAVWLMGVWKRSKKSADVALHNESLLHTFAEALDDFTTRDVIGSPYSVAAYTVDERLGGNAALASAREALASRGVGLILDYVPNHVAHDHPWTREHPECFLEKPAGIEDDDSRFADANGRKLALGRDPFFAPWPDVVQLNAFSPALRDMTAATLQNISNQCDGVRCDMAMLMINDVFARTWGDMAGEMPEAEFWPQVINAVRSHDSNFVFIAEAYWDMEDRLLSQGFDYAYDKRLYDRLAHEDASSVRKHLEADIDYQSHLLRFLENHDEPRAAATFPHERERAAAIITAFLPGAKLYHDGQFEGLERHTPVFLDRRAGEPTDPQRQRFYRQLVKLSANAKPEADWQLGTTEGWPDNDSAENILAWSATTASGRFITAVNFSPMPSQGRIQWPWPEDNASSLHLVDSIENNEFKRSGSELLEQGLFVDLPPWKSHVFQVVHSPRQGDDSPKRSNKS